MSTQGYALQEGMLYDQLSNVREQGFIGSPRVQLYQEDSG